MCRTGLFIAMWVASAVLWLLGATANGVTSSTEHTRLTKCVIAEAFKTHICNGESFLQNRYSGKSAFSLRSLRGAKNKKKRNSTSLNLVVSHALTCYQSRTVHYTMV